MDYSKTAQKDNQNLVINLSLFLLFVVSSLLLIYQYRGRFEKNLYFSQLTQTNNLNKVKVVTLNLNTDKYDIDSVNAFDIKIDPSVKGVKLISSEPGDSFKDGIKIVWDDKNLRYALARNPESRLMNEQKDKTLIILKFESQSSLVLNLDSSSMVYIKGGEIVRR